MNENPKLNNEGNDMIDNLVDATNVGDDSQNVHANDTDTVNSEEKQEQRNIASSIFDYFEIFVISIITVLMVFSLFLRIARVDGGSMNQTLKNGESLVISNLFLSAFSNEPAAL